ncbi:unnamed protein product [Acanthoscelides obtectus]|uniref:Uncharacterized protein n=1 Tax=Acanthoscelides obtectus TaxID=200917 RepID=A0A9P0MIZ7_ACAOB|nr:unnamed protein product [Acanthoscelides obtectus]CAK1627024.1 hypothetical protein AOBTE_LOCUS4232 [Acanthoscelides obtectus]
MKLYEHNEDNLQPGCETCTIWKYITLIWLKSHEKSTDNKRMIMKKGSIRPIAAHLPLPELKPFIEGNTGKTAIPDPQPSSSTVLKSPPTLRLLNQEPARKRSRIATEKSSLFPWQKCIRKKLRDIVKRQAEAQETMAGTLKELLAYIRTIDKNE